MKFMAKKRKGLFIVLEGADRTGKSTHTKKLVGYLRNKGFDLVFTREPGGTKFAEGIRKLLLNPKHKVVPLAELMLYEASRAQNTREKILPALKKGKIVLCERYAMSSVVYQGYGRKIPIKTVNALNKIATSGLKPDLTVVFDMPPADFKFRGKGLKSDRFESENAYFRSKVRNAYLRLAKKTPNTILIRTNKPIYEVQKELRKVVIAVIKDYKK
jgi:dTMP kinase